MRRLLPLLSTGLVLLALALWAASGGDVDAPPALTTGHAVASTGEDRPPVAVEVAPGGGPAEAERVPASTEPDVPAGSDDAAGDGPRILTGRVLDGAGAPVVGARVLLGATHGGWDRRPLEGRLAEGARGIRSCASDGDGRFACTWPEGEKLRLVVLAPGHVRHQEDREREELESDGDEGVWGEVVLTAAVVLTGRVLDHGGMPVVGASLDLMPAEAARWWGLERTGIPVGETGTGGEFRVDTAAAGAWELRATSDRHPTGSARGTTTHVGEHVGGIEIHLVESGSIHGHLVGIPAGEEQALEVRARPAGVVEDLMEDLGSVRHGGAFDVREATVGEGGEFVLEGLQADTDWRLYARAVGEGLGRSSQRRSVTVLASPGDRGVELVWLGEVAITGRVLDGSSGQPLQEFDARARAGGVGVNTTGRQAPDGEQGDGRFRIGGFRPREASVPVEVSVDALGYLPWKGGDRKLVRGEDLDLGEIRMTPTGIVLVRVTDRGDGEPIARASVTLSVDEGEVTEDDGLRIVTGRFDDDGPLSGENSTRERTDKHGAARLSAFPSTTCRLEVTAGGFAPALRGGIALPPSGIKEIEVSLGRGGDVVVFVVDGSGAAVAGREITHRDGAGGGGTTSLLDPSWDGEETDREGLARFTHLSPGVHEFRAEAGRGGGSWLQFIDDQRDAAKDWVAVTVVEGETAEVFITDKPTGSLVGTVTEIGEPLVDALVSLRDGSTDDDPRAGEAFFLPGMGGFETRTGPRGGWRLDGMAPGAWIVEVRHPTRAMAERFDVLLGTGEQRVDLDLSLAVLEGRVTDERGQGLEGVRVRAREVGGRETSGAIMISSAVGDEDALQVVGTPTGGDTVRSGTDGSYRLRGVISGVPLRVHASGGPWIKAALEPVTVSEGVVLVVEDLVLRQGGTLEIHIASADGSPTGLAIVQGDRIRDGDGKAISGGGREEHCFGMARHGTATIRGLAPGLWRLNVQVLEGGDVDLPDRDEIVTAGEPTVVRFVVP